MALAARRHGSRLASQTLKSLSGFLNTEERSASQSACSGPVQPQPQTDPFKKALLRSFWAGSWKTSTVPGRTVQQQSYSSIVYPPVEAKVGKAAPEFTAPGMFPWSTGLITFTSGPYPFWGQDHYLTQVLGYHIHTLTPFGRLLPV